MPKYKEYYQKMIEQNKELFDGFRIVHDNYGLDPDSWQEQLNTQGEKVQAVIREWENRLCANSERGGYALYTTGLADKFQNEIRKYFPYIDSIGIIIKHNSALKPLEFNIKKIKLN